jgi:hypothetical protein
VTQAIGFYGTDSLGYDAVGNLLSRARTSGGTTSSVTYSYNRGTNQLFSAAQKGSSTLAAAFGEVQQARHEVRQRLAAQPFDPDALAKAVAEVRVKQGAYFTALQEIILPAIGKLSPEGRKHLLPGMGR